MSEEQTEKTRKFVHLRAHTDFSIVTGVMKIKDIVTLAQQYNMPAVTVTDLNMFCGLIKLYESATGSGIKPLSAIDTQFLDDRGVLHDITLFAKNERGYVNLRKIMTETYLRARGKQEVVTNARSLQNTKRDARIYITYAQMQEHVEGILCLLPAYFGPLGNSVREDKMDFADPVYERLKSIYGDNLYQGIARCKRPGERGLEPHVIRYAAKYQMPLVATNDVMFKRRGDYHVLQIRECISQGVVMSDYQPDYTEEQYFKSSEEMIKLFEDLPQAIDNTNLIAQICTVKFKLGHNDLPRFHLDPTDPKQAILAEEFKTVLEQNPDIDEEEWILDKLSWQGLEERLEFLYPDPTEREEKRPAYVERLEFELKIIKEMKFPGYFLIVQEFINWSKNKGIPVGPGRGSGAGSLVAYSLKITDLDPLKYALLFERFLNPMRKSMPDFDVDFCNEGRSTVIEHMQDHYGKDSVSQIMTFGTMGAKMVVKDVARVLGIDRRKADDLAKVIMDKIEVKTINEDGEEDVKTYKGNLANNVEHNQAFRSYYENTDEPEYRNIVEYSRPLEGLVRQVGKHAAGIVISPIDMNEYSSLYIDDSGEQSTHFDKDDIERAGLVKFDFLGLKNLTIIKNALRMINKRYQREGRNEVFDINTIPLDDPATYKLLQDGDTHGVFQLESAGITKLVMKACPKTFEDIIAIIALYRPGPLQSGMVDNYINRKNGSEEVCYPTQELNFEVLKDILDPTYGVIVYQEQVMQIAQTFSGYTLGDADNLRRAMGKKKADVMAKERSNFVAGAVKNGFQEEQASSLFDLVDKFAGYGFNKSHSAAYALVSYQTAYLKAHFRAEFLAAVMTNAQSDISKIYGTVKDLKNAKRGIKIDYIRPSVNYSFDHFDVDSKGRIIYSLAALKGVGVDVIKEMVKERERNGQFTDFYNFIDRCGSYFSETQLKVMICAGCFDDFINEGNNAQLGHSREAYLHVLKPIISAVKQSSFGNLFAELTENIDTYIRPEIEKEIKHWSIEQRASKEYDAFNFYFAGHPINEYAAERAAIADCSCLDDVFRRFEEYTQEVQNAVVHGMQRHPMKKYTIVAHVDGARKDKSFDGKRTVLDLAISDESSNYRNNVFVGASANEIAQLIDDLLEDGKCVVEFQFSSYQKRETKETNTSMRIKKVIPLQQYLKHCIGKITALFDVRSVEAIGNMAKYRDYYLVENAQYPGANMPLTFEMMYYTNFGVATNDKVYLTRYTPELLKHLKEISGIHNIKLELTFIDPGKSTRDEDPSMYERARPENNMPVNRNTGAAANAATIF
ncbi:DNA polymerase III subunit alpha [Psittacicella hinzii]|uniref:DNA polymerase III subunit alpha n=1 Tax=Psittacicella hinzii TaxID=2028575 RepID=A0A3A1YVH0_9GAMM|nr:DNA polymerase III subunit alpha [Psittacicella hinzii]RIY40454.1 DNA polymerase III subunit alpha [Psittacicella hinzii]